jgi:hypothetical protein
MRDRAIIPLSAYMNGIEYSVLAFEFSALVVNLPPKRVRIYRSGERHPNA